MSLKGDLGRRQGDYMERVTPSLAGERWNWGVPRDGDSEQAFTEVSGRMDGPTCQLPGKPRACIARADSAIAASASAGSRSAWATQLW